MMILMEKRFYPIHKSLISVQGVGSEGKQDKKRK